jgi:membrane associated rhomboid family serine protease
MLLLLPISHEDSVVRRMPWVSLGIVGVCVALQVHSCAVVPDLERRGREIAREMREVEERALAVHFERRAAAARKLRDQRLLEQLGSGEPEVSPGSQEDWEDWSALDPSGFRKGKITPPDDPHYLRYKKLEAELASLKLELPAERFGYRPALDGFASLLSSMFAHGGWLHLIGNMWFLCLVGCNLEDRWGRWQFLFFYLVAGVLAALTFTALHPGEKTSLVGASGAVAGAMGAFMFCFARTRVKIFYFYMLLLTPRYGTFRASAWLVLAFWVLDELLMTLVEASSNMTGIAHSAHAGGFVFGGAVAFLLQRLGVDTQLDEASERAADDATVVFQEHPLYVQAVRQRAEGQNEAAIEALVRLVGEAPDHAPAHELLLEIGLERRDLRCVDFGLPVALEHQQRSGDHAALVAVYRELRRKLPDYGLSDKELLRVASAAGKLNDGPLVIQTVTELMEQHPGSPALPRALWLAAQTQGAQGAVELQRDTLRRLLQRFPQHAVATLARGELERMGVTS